MYEELINALLKIEEEEMMAYGVDCYRTGEAADALESLVSQLAAIQAENAELRTQHRIERCEATGYDCEELGKLLAALSRVEAERDAAKRDIESILHSCTCEVRHEFCVRSDEPGGCDSDDCHDAKWRGAQGEG